MNIQGHFGSQCGGGTLVTDARDQQPFEPEEFETGHFCASLHVGHARRKVFDYRITDLEAQIKTKQTNKPVKVFKFW